MKKVKKHLRILTTAQLVALAVRSGSTIQQARALTRPELIERLTGVVGVLRPTSA